MHQYIYLKTRKITSMDLLINRDQTNALYKIEKLLSLGSRALNLGINVFNYPEVQSFKLTNLKNYIKSLHDKFI
jgi:hypothetical protein